jgi:hypothetical protein
MPRSAWIFPALAVRGASVGPDLGAQRRAAAADCAAGVLLAKKFWLVVDAVAARIGAPPAFAGLLVALLILLPEGVAAVSAARKNDLQKSINLALGSSLATIGLTIPAVGVATYALDKELTRGLSGQGSVPFAPDLLPEHADLRYEQDQCPVRAGPYGGICRLCVHGFRA